MSRSCRNQWNRGHDPSDSFGLTGAVITEKTHLGTTKVPLSKPGQALARNMSSCIHNASRIKGAGSDVDYCLFRTVENPTPHSVRLRAGREKSLTWAYCQFRGSDGLGGDQKAIQGSWSHELNSGRSMAGPFILDSMLRSVLHCRRMRTE